LYFEFVNDALFKSKQLTGFKQKLKQTTSHNSFIVNHLPLFKPI